MPRFESGSLGQTTDTLANSDIPPLNINMFYNNLLANTKGVANIKGVPNFSFRAT
jgi:hypothetical protein